MRSTHAAYAREHNAAIAKLHCIRIVKRVRSAIVGYFGAKPTRLLWRWSLTCNTASTGFVIPWLLYDRRWQVVRFTISRHHYKRVALFGWGGRFDWSCVCRKVTTRWFRRPCRHARRAFTGGTRGACPLPKHSDFFLLNTLENSIA